jgi:hypothetical protein
MSSRLPVASTALAAATLILLSGCASGTPTSAGSASPGASVGETDDAATEEEATLSGPDCLIGDWYIENDQMQGFYDALAEASGSPVDFNITGGTGLSFTGTEYTYTPEFELTLSLSGIDGSGAITGQVTGDYEATESTITTAHEESNVELIIVVGGVTQDGAGLFGDILRSAPINSAPYECSPEGPIIDFETSGDRHSVQLTARS